MKIKLVSDLHLEFSDFVVENNDNVDLLILGGDIMIAQNLHDFPEDDAVLPLDFTNRAKAERFRNFLKRVSRDFPKVIYIAGNHEFYHGKFPDALDYLKTECDKLPNVHFLEMSTVDIDDLTFIGATLWTDMNQGDPTTIQICRTSMNDYRTVRDSTRDYSKLNPLTTLRHHRSTLSYIAKTIADRPDRRYVVVGHHAPTKISTKPCYEKDIHLNGAYRSDLVDFISNHPQIELWTHGHTHNPYDYVVGGCRVVCNPRGYEGFEEDSGWDPNLVITI